MALHARLERPPASCILPELKALGNDLINAVADHLSGRRFVCELYREYKDNYFNWHLDDSVQERLMDSLNGIAPQQCLRFDEWVQVNADIYTTNESVMGRMSRRRRRLYNPDYFVCDLLILVHLERDRITAQGQG